MTALEDVTKKRAESSAEAAAARELVRLAKEQGLSLTGPNGLLKQFTEPSLNRSGLAGAIQVARWHGG